MQALPLGGGVSSGIFRVDLRSGSYCVKQALPRFKVAKEWRVPVERVFSEIDYLRTVGGIVPGSVPRVIGQDDATKSFVMEFLGPEFRNWKAQLLAGDVDARIANQVGDVLGRIHSATADRCGPRSSLRHRRQLLRDPAGALSRRELARPSATRRRAPRAGRSHGRDAARARARRRQPEEHSRRTERAGAHRCGVRVVRRSGVRRGILPEPLPVEGGAPAAACGIADVVLRDDDAGVLRARPLGTGT